MSGSMELRENETEHRAVTRPAEAFLIRLWREPGQTDGKGNVRVSVRQLINGELRYLADLSDLGDYLMSRFGGQEAEELQVGLKGRNAAVGRST